MDRLYGEFVRPADLVFDVGAHVGDRIACFRRLGARVIAVEPQPALVRTLRVLYGRDGMVVIEPAAVGRSAGTIILKLNIDNPTVATASEDFTRAAQGAHGWEGQSWEDAIEVPLTTLDLLIARHGMPRFIKLDVEGFESEALAALSQPVSALSFEFTTIQRDMAASCIERCLALGYRRFNAALGESQTMVYSGWRSGREVTGWLHALPDAANSGDIYAALQ
jgi:FkbM family methyltransferase